MQSTTAQASMHMSAETSTAAASCSCSLPKLSTRAAIASWSLQIISAAILGQTLFFKFSAAPEPVYIFTTLGVEPWGRIAAAVSELIAVLLLLVPRTAAIGAFMSIGIMLGAIGAHLGPLGIVVKDDGGLLFGLGVVVLLAATGVLLLRRAQGLAQLRSGLGMLGFGPRPMHSGTRA